MVTRKTRYRVELARGEGLKKGRLYRGKTKHCKDLAPDLKGEGVKLPNMATCNEGGSGE